MIFNYKYTPIFFTITIYITIDITIYINIQLYIYNYI